MRNISFSINWPEILLELEKFRQECQEVDKKKDKMFNVK